MALHTFIKSLRDDTDGAAGVIVVGSIIALVGAATVAVDFGSVFLAKRRLQGIADAAAMAAADDIQNGGHVSAQAIIDRSGAAAVNIHRLVPGRYTRDKSVPLGQRFTAASEAPTAARVVLTQDVPLFFGALFSGGKGMRVRAEATAARTDMAAFSLGTRLAELSGGLPNQILSALAGSELGLTALDGQTLASTNVDLLHFADALRVKLDKPEATYAEVLRTPVPLDDVVAVMATVAPEAAGGQLLDTISGKLTGGSIKVSDIVDLGPLGQSDHNDGKTEVTIDAFSMLRAALELSQGDQYEISLDVSALGLAKTKLKLVGGSGEVHSPFMTITQANDVVLRTAQTRLYLDSQIGTAGLGLLSLRLPVYAELASAEARLTDIECDRNDPDEGVTLEVTPAIGTVAVADIDKQAMEDLTRPLPILPALVAYTPLAQVHGSAKVALGGVSPQSVHFTPEEVEQKLVQSVDTNDLVGGVATSLIKDLKINVSLLGGSLLGGIGLGPLGTTVGSQLKLVAPVVDGLLNQITDTLGVRLGVANVRVDKLRCGVPLIVS